MKTLHDLHVEKLEKEKRIEKLFIVLVGLFSIFAIVLLFTDPWDIAYKRQEKEIKEREAEFSQIYKDYLDESKYTEAFYLEYNLNLYNLTPDLYSLLSDGERIKEHIANDLEGKPQDNYYTLEYLVNNFYDEYLYQKKYKAPSNYLEDIKEEVEDYLIGYNYFSQEDLDKYMEAK